MELSWYVGDIAQIREFFYQYENEPLCLEALVILYYRLIE
jgi:hypothetical protein